LFRRLVKGEIVPHEFTIRAEVPINVARSDNKVPAGIGEVAQFALGKTDPSADVEVPLSILFLRAG
jgi:hypothetical protein